ncbi:MAG TPA: hypothetical protein VFL80_06270 [Thermoanaerobaculia bacterium]|nr:hypothetical protein [Thermoanaerobaculia bacterium]
MGRIEHPATSRPSPGVPPLLAAFLEEAREWCHGRSWIPRALLLLYLVYAEARFLIDPLSRTIFSGITLAFHEMGHLLFGFAGEFIGILMGSGMQLIIPLIVIVVFYRQPDYFGMAVGGFWLSFSMFELANYVGDARAMDLPLVGFTDDPQHDWHYLLSTTGLLPLDTTLALLLRLAATATGAASLGFAVWLLWQMHLYNRAR